MIDKDFFNGTSDIKERKKKIYLAVNSEKGKRKNTLRIYKHNSLLIRV